MSKYPDKSIEVAVELPVMERTFEAIARSCISLVTEPSMYKDPKEPRSIVSLLIDKLGKSLIWFMETESTVAALSANSEYGTLLISLTPKREKFVPPEASISTWKEYGPSDQSTPDTVPITGVPEPIFRLTSPKLLVVDNWVS